MFLKRVLEEHCKVENKHKMDFDEFVLFHLVTENPKIKKSTRYIFQAVDVFGRGYIDSFVFNLFFQQITEKLV